MPAVSFAHRGGSCPSTPATSARVAQCLAGTAGSMSPRASSVCTRQAAQHVGSALMAVPQVTIPATCKVRLRVWANLRTPERLSRPGPPVATCDAAFSLCQRRILRFLTSRLRPRSDCVRTWLRCRTAEEPGGGARYDLCARALAVPMPRLRHRRPAAGPHRAPGDVCGRARPGGGVTLTRARA